MKIIKYRLRTLANQGTEEKPNIVESFHPVVLEWNEANEEIAKREAYNGEYTIEDDGVETTPTETEDLSALLVDHEYRLTLLELGITE